MRPCAEYSYRDNFYRVFEQQEDKVEFVEMCTRLEQAQKCAENRTVGTLFIDGPEGRWERSNGEWVKL